ncbi:MAG: radical SAM protein [archaeon]
MKVTLINPGLFAADRYGKALGKMGPTCEPLGLAYLAAAIRDKHEVSIIDVPAFHYSYEDIIKILKEQKPDIVGLTIMTPWYMKTKEMISIIKENIPNQKIIVGGPHVTVFPEVTLEEDSNIEFAVYGEAEQTFPELLDALEKNLSLKEIKGLIYRENNKIIKNLPRDFVKNIDSISQPARDLLPMDKYRAAPTYYLESPSFLILSSRGCPFNCSYCSKVSGRFYRHHSVERVMEEINLLIDKYKAKELIFRDDTFTVDKTFTEALCNEMIKQGINKKIRWTCMTRVNLVTPDLLKLMKKAGCWSMHYGIESGSQRLLNLIQKGITIQQARDAIKWTNDAGIETKAFFMLGLPSETREESLQTIKFAKEIKADWIQVTITTPYPGTELFELAKADGTLKSTNWKDYQTWAGWANSELVYLPKGRNSEELKALQKQAMRSFYFRPKFILNRIKDLRYKGKFKSYVNGAKALLG